MTDSMTNNTLAADETLFRAWRQRGDKNALSELKDRHRTGLEYYAVNRLYGLRCPIGDAREIVERVFSVLADYRRGTSVQAWLYAVANQAVKEHVRQRAVVDPRQHLIDGREVLVTFKVTIPAAPRPRAIA